MRPAAVRGMGQLQPVHAARHLDIGEQQGDVVAQFEDLNGFVGADGLDRHEPGILDDVDGAHPQDHLVFDDQDDRRGVSGGAIINSSVVSSTGMQHPGAAAEGVQDLRKV